MGAGCGADEDRRISCWVLRGPEEFLLGICHAVEFPSIDCTYRKNARQLGIDSCQVGFRIQNNRQPDQNESDSVRRKNNMPPAHPATSTFC